MKIISFAGQMASGKTTIANYLASKSHAWHRLAFGDAVKQIFMKGFDLDVEFINDHKREKQPPEGFQKNVRQALQFIGDGFREIKSDVWIEKLFKTVQSREIGGFTGFLIDDVRYFDEARAIKKRYSNAINVLIQRPGFENDDPHPSESQIKLMVDLVKETYKHGPIIQESPSNYHDFDFFFINDALDLDGLYDKIDRTLCPLFERFND